MKKLVVSLVVASFFGLILSGVNAAAEKQPVMKDALATLEKALGEQVGDGKIRHLNKAKALLQKATADKGGHRVAAIRDIDKALGFINAKKLKQANASIRQAIQQVKRGIAADNRR